jgi:hypothetical protein
MTQYEAEAMRQQTQLYLMAVLREHPELFPEDEIGRFDPYPCAPTKPPRVLTEFEQVIQTVANKTGLAVREITGKGRHKALVRARWEVFAQLRKLGYSLPYIGRVCGGRDHTTVLHGLRRMGVR